MSKLFFSVAISMDGFIAGLSGSPKNPIGDGGIEMHKWIYNQKKFRQLLEKGVRLFDNINKNRFTVNIVEAIHPPMITHLRYKVYYK